MPDPSDLHSPRDFVRLAKLPIAVGPRPEHTVPWEFHERHAQISQAKPVLLYVYGHDDPSSLRMDAILLEVAHVFGDDLDVVPIEIGACRKAAHIDRVADELPHLVLVVDGMSRGRLTGPRWRREIAAFPSRHLGPGSSRNPLP